MLFNSAPAEASPQPTQLSASQLPIELQQAVARDLHLTPEQYLDRAAKAQLLGQYARTFRANRPADFAGAFLDNSGTPVIAVTSTNAAALAARDGFHTKLAPISADNLENSLAELNRWLAALPRQLASQVQATSIDILNNNVVIDIVDSPIGRMLNLPTLLANLQVVMLPGGGGPIEHRPMGGDTFVTARTPLPGTPLGQITVCSLGFNSIDNAGQPLNITAGHCNPNAPHGGAPVYLPNRDNVTTSVNIGSFVRSVTGDSSHLDYSVIRFNGAGVAAGLDRPSVRGASGTTLTVTGTAVPVTGAPVCKSGQSSEFTCGIVSADQVEASVFGDDGLIRTVRGFADTACTLAGDSGGAIVTGTLALGITSGSNSAEAPDCGQANIALAQDGGTSSLGIAVRDILADANARGLGAGIRVRASDMP
ncbi:protease [Skermania sp. ID1734]|nr:protease [Skermania sp. ID1734]